MQLTLASVDDEYFEASGLRHPEDIIDIPEDETPDEYYTVLIHPDYQFPSVEFNLNGVSSSIAVGELAVVGANTYNILSEKMTADGYGSYLFYKQGVAV